MTRNNSTATYMQRTKSSEIVKNLRMQYSCQKTSIILGITTVYTSTVMKMTTNYQLGECRYHAPNWVIHHIISWYEQLDKAAPSFCAPHKESANGAA